MTRAKLFEAIRPYAPDQRFTPAMVTMIDSLADRFGLPRGDAGRVTSEAGKKAIIAHEGVRLTAYPDPATNGDPWTVGVGHTGADVHRGLVITNERAEQLLEHDLKRFEAAVNQLAPKTTQNQFDALVSFAFNLGEADLAGSTLLKKHNAGDYIGAASEFGRWNRADGKIMAGLTKRRAGEAAMYRG